MRPVWARGEVWAAECPRSFVTAESLSLLDAYAFWRIGGTKDGFDEMPARAVDALMLLEAEERAEREHGNGKD